MMKLIKAKVEENDLHVSLDNELVQVQNLPDGTVNWTKQKLYMPRNRFQGSH